MKNKRLFISLLLLICMLISSCGGKKKPALESEKNIKMLTQNVCMQSSVLATNYAEKDYASKIKSDTKLPCTFDLIKIYDIVALQEANDEYSVDELVRKWYAEKKIEKGKNIDFSQPLLFQKKPIKPKKNQAQIVSGDNFVLGPDLDNGEYTGGLLILSKHKIIKSGGFVFTEKVGLKGGRADGFFNKGVIYARIQIPKGDYIHVFNTHLQSGKSSNKDIAEYFKLRKEYENKTTEDKTKKSIELNPIFMINDTREKQLIEIKKFIIEKTKDDNLNRPIFVLGDFNIDNQSDYIIGNIKSDNITFKNTVVAVDPKRSNPDTWLGNDQKGKDTKETPWGERGNKLANEAGKGESIDYIFYSSKKKSPNTQAFVTIKKLNTVPSKLPSNPYCFPETETEVLSEKIKGDLKKEIEEKFKIDKENYQKDITYPLGGEAGLNENYFKQLNNIIEKDFENDFGDAIEKEVNKDLSFFEKLYKSIKYKDITPSLKKEYAVKKEYKDTHKFKDVTGSATITRSGPNFILGNAGYLDKAYVFRIMAKETPSWTSIVARKVLKNNVITIYKYDKLNTKCVKKAKCGKGEEDYSTISDHMGLEIEFDFQFYEPKLPTPTPSSPSTQPPQPTSTPISSEEVAPAPVSSAPIISNVEFPATIKAGEPGDGIVYFEDANGDINWVQFVLMRTGCITSDFFDFDPMEFIIEGNKSKGTFGFHQDCKKCSTDAQGKVEMTVYLYDKDGNASEGYMYSFTCK